MLSAALLVAVAGTVARGFFGAHGMHYTAIMGWVSFTSAFWVMALTGAPPRSQGRFLQRLREVLTDPSILIVLGLIMLGLAAVYSAVLQAIAQSAGLGVIGAEGLVALALSGVTVWRMFG